MNTATINAGELHSKAILVRILLFCGVISSLLYAAMNIFVPMQFPGYSFMSHTISELSAIDAPTRDLWAAFGGVYTVLIASFGWGIWKSAAQNHRLRNAGILIIIYAVIGLFWPPMHQREVIAAGGGTITDTLHLVFTFVTAVLMMVIIGFCAVSFGKGFRLYSVLTVLVLVGFGVLTGLDSPKLEANLPTPLIGLWERISIGAYMIWIIVLAFMAMRREKHIQQVTN